SLAWNANDERDLAGYRVWRAERPDELLDVRRRAGHAEIAATADVVTVTWRDEGLVGLRDWYYRVGAVDAAGNVSEPTRVLKVRPVDTHPPAPPTWTRAEWVKRRQSDGRLLPSDAPEDPRETYPPVVALEWTADEDGIVCRLERRAGAQRIFGAVSGWLGPERSARHFRFLDETADAAADVWYRVPPRDAAGNEQRYAWLPVRVPPAGGGAWSACKAS